MPPAAPSNTRMNVSPIALRFSSGSSTPESTSKKRSAARGVHDLGMELHAVQPAVAALESRDRRVGGGGGHDEPVGGAGDRVGVAHPDLLRGWHLEAEQHARVADAQFGAAVFAAPGAG